MIRATLLLGAALVALAACAPSEPTGSNDPLTPIVDKPANPLLPPSREDPTGGAN